MQGGRDGFKIVVEQVGVDVQRQSAAKASQESRADIPNKRHTTQGDLSHTRLSRAMLSLTEGDCIMGAALGALAPDLRRTLTWDQGKELALHQQITARTGTGVYFCDAHSPWQRGSNENTNGLLRDYFPKGADLSTISPQELQRVADELNDRPRKTLGWARPAGLIADVAIRTA